MIAMSQPDPDTARLKYIAGQLGPSAWDEISRVRRTQRGKAWVTSEDKQSGWSLDVHDCNKIAPMLVDKQKRTHTRAKVRTAVATHAEEGLACLQREDFTGAKQQFEKAAELCKRGIDD